MNLHSEPMTVPSRRSLLRELSSYCCRWCRRYTRSCYPPRNAVNVCKRGAVGDGCSDDTRAIQDAIDSIPFGSVYIPDGMYRISVSDSDPWAGINLKSHVDVYLAMNAILFVTPKKDRLTYALFHADEQVDIRLCGGTLVGDRFCRDMVDEIKAKHDGSHGMGIWLNGCQGISVSNTRATEFLGDGFYVGGKGGKSNPSKDIKFTNVVGDRNRRNGLSITNATKVSVEQSVPSE